MKLNNVFLFGDKKRFYNGWQRIFTENAKVFNGMFASVKRMSEGKAKNPDKVVKELCSRAEYNIDRPEIKKLCKITADNLSSDNRKRDKWIKLLMTAVEDALIYCENKSTLEISEKNINDYIEWDGNEICLGDTVDVMNPAWYQNGKLIEQGHCTVVSE